MKTPEMHGRSKDRIYHVWKQMIQRCENPNHPQFKDWGGRGITICHAWRSSFVQFASDMGPRPESGTLERVDNDKGYSSDNCRWASRREQRLNTRPAARYRNNTTGLPGVYRDGPRFFARISVNKREIYLGSSTDFFEACCLRKSAEAAFRNYQH